MRTYQEFISDDLHFRHESALAKITDEYLSGKLSERAYEASMEAERDAHDKQVVDWWKSRLSK
jgi:hypothetical protein